MWSYFRRVAAAGVQSVSGPTSNIASLCVFYNALCWWMCRGISGRSVSVAEGHTMWDIQSLCEHCAFGINGSCDKDNGKRQKNEGEGGIWVSSVNHASIPAINRVFIIFCRHLSYDRLISSNESSEVKKKNEIHTCEGNYGYRSIRNIESTKSTWVTASAYNRVFPVTYFDMGMPRFHSTYLMTNTRWIARREKRESIGFGCSTWTWTVSRSNRHSQKDWWQVKSYLA